MAMAEEMPGALRLRKINPMIESDLKPDVPKIFLGDYCLL